MDKAIVKIVAFFMAILLVGILGPIGVFLAVIAYLLILKGLS